MDRRSFLGGGAAAALVVPSSAFGQACLPIDPTEGFTDASVRAFLWTHLTGARSWQDILNGVDNMTDYQMSWVPSVLPSMVMERLPALEPGLVKSANDLRNATINHLYATSPYKDVLNSEEFYNQRPPAALIQQAVNQVDRDVYIPDDFKQAVKDGLTLSSWNYLTTGLALIQADLISDIAPAQSNFLRERLLGENGYPAYTNLVTMRLRCDGKQLDNARPWVPTKEL